jgi:hypothetical protein
MKKNVYLMLNVLFSMALVSDVFADETSATEQHVYKGFFLRAQEGVSFVMSSTTIENDVSLSVFAPSNHLSLDLGGAVAKNTILYGSLVFDAGFSRELKLKSGGVELSVTEEEEGTVLLPLAGMGVCYYLPLQFFVDVSGLVGIVDLGFPSESSIGFGIAGGGQLGFGKEWWLSEKFALGGRLWYRYLTHADDESNRWHTNTVGFGLTGTYN